MTTDKIRRFEALVSEDPKNPLHRFALAGAYLDAEDWEQADAAYARCIEQDPKWMMAYIRRGRCLIELSRWDEARQMLDRAAGLATTLGHDEPFDEIRGLLEQLPD